MSLGLARGAWTESTLGPAHPAQPAGRVVWRGTGAESARFAVDGSCAQRARMGTVHRACATCDLASATRQRSVRSPRWAPWDYGTAAMVDDEVARWAAGATGESVVAEALGRLDGDHIVINNLPLARRGDADHVVVGPGGAVVIETKYLSGRIICEAEDVWFQVKREEERLIASPAAQVQRVADGVTDLLASNGMCDVPVYALLVMAHPRAVLEVEQSPVLVVRPFELVAQLRQLAREQPRLTAAGVATAANALLNLGSVAPAGNSQARWWRRGR